MNSPFLNENNFEIKEFISKEINKKSTCNKKHSDSLNCLINCAEFRVTLHITQKPYNGKDNIYFIQKDKFSPLFFYDIPSNKIIDEIQFKNEAQKLLNYTSKIKTENDIIDKYEQNRKNKMLLFNYIKFPLINSNSENNDNKLSTLIILDNGVNDFISNFSTDSSFVYHQTCCISLTIRNVNNCDYLFSLADIKDCKEIKIRLNGTVHEQPLFDKEIICYLSHELIDKSIKERMEIYNNSDNIENLLGKYFFTKLNDENYNNIGILFSLKKKSENSKLQYDKDYLKTDRYLINKIFLFMDMWLNDNNNKSNKHKTTSSTNTSSHMIFNYNYKFDDKNQYKTNFNFYPNEIDYNYQNNLYNFENRPYNEISNNLINNIDNNEESNSKIVYNDINRIYINNRKKLFDNYDICESMDYSYNTDFNKYDYSLSDYNFKLDYSNFNDNYNEKTSDLNILFRLLENYQKYKESEEPKISQESDDNINNLYHLKEKEYDNSIKDNHCISEKENEKNIFVKRTLFINMNEELLRKLFEQFEEDKCISNYTIAKNMLDINMNLDSNKEKMLLKTKLTDFFDIFHNPNKLWLNIPFIDSRGKLYMNCFSPTLSSMLLVIKKNKEIKTCLKNIKLKCKKYRGFSYDTYDQNKKLFKIEFEEIKPLHNREILYKKIGKLKKIIGDTKIRNKDIMIKNSYFSVLWSVKNELNIKSSFLAYYSFDFKLIGILIINLDYNQWMAAFSYKLTNYHDYKTDYEKNVANVKNMFKNLAIDKDDQHCDNYFKYDYYNYLKSSKNLQY
jgi:hypothetical protein